MSGSSLSCLYTSSGDLTISGGTETYTAQVERYTDNQYTFYVQKEVTP